METNAGDLSLMYRAKNSANLCVNLIGYSLSRKPRDKDEKSKMSAKLFWYG